MSLSHDTLKALHEAATPGLWETDHEPDDEFRHHNYFIGADVGGKWRALLDTVNSDHKLIEDDRDEDGGSAWDAIGKANAELVTYLRNAVPEILTLITERDAMRGALEDISSSGSSAETYRRIARAALGGNHHGS